MEYKQEIYNIKEEDILSCLQQPKQSLEFARTNNKILHDKDFILERNEDFLNSKFYKNIIKKNIKDIILIGVGGSTLGSQTLYSLNNSDKKFHFFDNLCLDNFKTFERLMTPDIKKTAFIVISKSGYTLEVISQFLILISKLEKKLGSLEEIKDNFLVIAGSGNNPLKKIITKLGLEFFQHPENIGGRFSVLSIVGMYPAILMGLDYELMRKSAQNVKNNFFTESEEKNIAPFMGAVSTFFLASKRNINNVVIMPYDLRLEKFSQWLSQLYAESLGKGSKGINPILALGPKDQHSQLQLYLDGPDDKYYTFLFQNQKNQGDQVNHKNLIVDEINYLSKKRIGDLVFAQQESVLECLINKKRPIRVIRFNNLNEKVMSELFIHFMIETMVIGNLMGLNPFDQPAVEEVKRLTKTRLS